MPDAKELMLATRRSLLTRLKNFDDQDGWTEFYNDYFGFIYGVALRAGLTETEALDAAQTTFITVQKKIAEFKYDPARGDFRGWLTQITKWRVSDEFKKRIKCVPVAEDSTRATSLIERIPDAAAGERLEFILTEEWEHNLKEVALERVKEIVTPHQFQIFQLHVLKGWSVRKVCDALGVSQTKVYLAKHRVTKALKAEVDKMRKQEATAILNLVARP